MLRYIKEIIKGFFLVYNDSIGFHSIEKELVDKFYQVKIDTKTISPSIIVMIDGRYIHGGLSDRLRGIVSIYQFCKNHNIKFYIQHNYPFQLNDFLEPNTYNWLPEEETISYNSSHSKPILLNDFQLSKSLHKIYLKKSIRSCKQLHVYTNTNIYDAYYTENFSELFKPTPLLEKKIAENSINLGTNYIAVVLRFQQLLGDFKEDGYQILSNEKQQELIEKNINKIKEIYHNSTIGEKILVTSDSLKFLHEANKLDFVYIIPGKVVHMDYSENENNETYLKSFVDMFILAKAKEVYLLKTDEMYHSGFGKRAALINNILYKEILF